MHIVVSGLPASGKSTLGRQLAAALGVVLLDKDELLEALFDRPDNASTSRSILSRRADADLQARAEGASASVLVSWWRHPLSSGDTGTQTDWLAELRPGAIEVHCACSASTAHARFHMRDRNRRHGDRDSSRWPIEAFIAQRAFGALGLSRVLEVSTERAVDLDALVAQLQAMGLPQAAAIRP